MASLFLTFWKKHRTHWGNSMCDTLQCLLRVSKANTSTDPRPSFCAGVSLFVHRYHLSINRLCIVLLSSITGSVNTGQLILLFVTSDQHAEGRQQKFKCTAEGDRIVKAAFSSLGDSVKQTSKCCEKASQCKWAELALCSLPFMINTLSDPPSAFP